MLITCPECELQVSDKALNCPHCGYPIVTGAKRTKRQPNKRKRLPNGFGQITYMKGHNLRNPYRAMVTVAKSPTGKCIVKPLKPQSHFATYNDAYSALLEYNKNPYDLNDGITVKELYEKWTGIYFPTLKNAASTRTITSAWAYCSEIYSMRAVDVRARHIKGCIDNGKALIKGSEKSPSADTKSRIKSMFNLMFDYALEYELVEKNYARTFKISDDILDEIEETKNAHIPFTKEEMNKLWDNVERMKYVDLLLFQCYSGYRPQELGLLEIKNIDLVNDTMVGGMKTDAGTDRVVPIHPKVKYIVQRYYDEAIELGSEYLFNCTDTNTHRSSLKMTYDKYRHRVDKIVSNLNLNPDHRAHDGRKHFVTMAKNANLDEYAIKYIVGHKIDDITERVYTERDIEWLKAEMNKIPV